jgi:uncharacterized membrane protein YedE/YeeE
MTKQWSSNGPRSITMNGLRAKRWSPYAVGVGIGLLSVFAFATADRGLGITTPFEHGAALVYRGLAPAAAEAGGYFRDHTPKIGWEWMVVVGVFIGSLVSSKLSGDREHAIVPPMWQRQFGPSVALRMVFAFAGGLVMMLGARLARGCTSGHGITGALQLAVSSWIFISLAFAAAIATALLLYGRPRVVGGE